MTSCLVVYYSRTGITHGVAHRIASACACDIERVSEARPRRGLPGYLRCVYEAVLAKRPDILPPGGDPGAYDVVIIGTPVWAGRLSSPMRSYLHANAGRFRRLAAFCTMGGSGGEKVLDEVAALCGKPLVARLVLSDAEIRQDRDRDKLGLFVRGAAAAPG